MSVPQESRSDREPAIDAGRMEVEGQEPPGVPALLLAKPATGGR